MFSVRGWNKLRNYLVLLGMGKFRKEYTSREEVSRLNARRSLVARRLIKKGEKIKADDIAIKRPGIGISPEYLDLVVGGVALRDILEDEVLQFDAIRLSSKDSTL